MSNVCYKKKIPNSELISIIVHNTALYLLARLNWGEFLYQLLSRRKQGKARFKALSDLDHQIRLHSGQKKPIHVQY